LLQAIDELLQDIPGYHRFRWGVDKLDQLDPGFQGMLTSVAKWIYADDLPLLVNPSPVESLVQVEQLSGTKLEVVYDRLLGITSIQVLKRKTLPREVLERLAHNSSLLLDHYVLPNRKSKVGDQWTVPMEEVAGLIGAGYDASATGTMHIERGGDVQHKGKTCALLKILPESHADLVFKETGGEVTVSLTPGVMTGMPTAELVYSVDDLLVRKGRCHWNVELTQIPSSLLLRGTKQIEARCKSYYEATLESAGNSDAVDKPR
jgi:hypothetical protein